MKLKSVPKSPIDYTTYDFSDVDNHAISCPDYEQRSISRLSAYLTSPFPDALCKIRAVFTWIADNVEYNYNGVRGLIRAFTAEGDDLDAKRCSCAPKAYF
ncbi:hypothetical protein BDR26DRAFT_852267 [Obelidium mucronatum]|nr:hypothetical protein BDR26DRAFT_852267 [Obelidium mucronatum]